MKFFLVVLVFLAVGVALPAWAQLVPIGENAQPAGTPSPRESVCNDRIDNDNDGLIDCNDQDCFTYDQGPYTGCPLTVFGNEGSRGQVLCQDGYDNDHDGAVDCTDGDCRQYCSSPQPYSYFGWWGENCVDGVDNDNDGLIDCADSNCTNWNGEVPNCPLFIGEGPGLKTCGDNVDNDENGLKDCMESTCAQTYVCRVEYSCANNFDDDRDGKVDCKDDDCFLHTYCTTPEVCDSGQDEDHDQAVDCADLDCAGTAACTGVIFGRAEPMKRAVAGTGGALAAVAAVSAVVSVAGAAAGAQSGPELLRSLLPFSAVHRRQTPWGRMVEAGSNRPIAGVTVSLVDETGKVRATESSRHDGTFGFFIPAGTYRIIAQRDGYQFPAPAPDIALFPGESLYDGGWISITEESVLAQVIVGQELSHTVFASVAERFQGIWTRIQVWQARLAMPLLLVGGGLTLLSFWNRPSVLLALLLGVYVILFALELLLSRVARRAVGVVRDAITRGGVGLAVVRLLDRAGRLVATRVTLESGHFFLMPAPGKYRVEIVHRSYHPYVRESLSVRKFFFGVAGIRARLTPK